MVEVEPWVCGKTGNLRGKQCQECEKYFVGKLGESSKGREKEWRVGIKTPIYVCKNAKQHCTHAHCSVCYSKKMVENDTPETRALQKDFRRGRLEKKFVEYNGGTVKDLETGIIVPCQHHPDEKVEKAIRNGEVCKTLLRDLGKHNAKKVSELEPKNASG